MNQWKRKLGLIAFSGADGLDLSQFRVEFQVNGMDQESPNNAYIRVFNLSRATVEQVRSKKQVVLNAGYENGNYGVIFQGDIKQFKIGRLSRTDTYLDIFAADGDLGYNHGVVNTTLAKGSTQEDAAKALAAAMPGVQIDTTDSASPIYDKQHIPSLRGQVLWGMTRARLRNIATTCDFTWSIQNGIVTRIPRTGYLPGDVVKINVATGMIGMPEQTDGGIKVACLLNQRIRIGTLVQLNNDDINQLVQQDPNAAPIPYSQWAGFQFNASIAKSDGMYRVFAANHEGDTRGQAWYTHLTLLAVDVTGNQTNAVNPS